MLGDFAFLLDAAVRKLRRSIHRRLWRAKRKPFVHRAAHGLRFRLHPNEYIDGDIFIEGIYELYYLRLIVDRFAGEVMLDVGANIGNHALYLARHFECIHCFEPNPMVADRLEENIALNGLDLCVHRVGLGRDDAELPFFTNTSGNLGNSGFQDLGQTPSGSLPVRNGDRYLTAHGIDRVDFIKIDVEGFEREVLAGLSATIERCRPALFIEYDGAGADGPNALLDWLPDYDFYVPNGRRALRAVTRFERILY